MNVATEHLAALVAAAGDRRAAMRLIVNRVATQRGRPAPWPEQPPPTATAFLDELGDISDWGAAALGHAYTRTLDTTQRDSAGIYYTPEAIADAMVWAALSPRLGDRRKVRVLDPACGAGVFLEAAAIILAGRDRDIRPEIISAAVYGMDIDPVAVDVATSALWLCSDGTRPISSLARNITCANPLHGQSPPRLGAAPGHLVIVGNPPYKDKAKGAAPWLETPRAAGEPVSARPSMDEFRDRAHAKTGYVLANLATYFWRWALWRAYQARTGGAVVAFITPSAFLQSPTYAPMRRMIRALADEGWVINLTPEGRQPSISTRVFAGVQIPLCITIMARRGSGDAATPADIQLMNAEGDRAAKIHRIRAACAHIAKRAPGVPEPMRDHPTTTREDALHA